MNSNKIYFCFKVNTVHQAIKTTYICNNNKIVPIFFIHFYIINGIGPNWIIEFRNLLLKKFKNISDIPNSICCPDLDISQLSALTKSSSGNSVDW